MPAAADVPLKKAEASSDKPSDYGATETDAPVELSEVAEDFGVRRIHVQLILLHWLASTCCSAVTTPAPLVLGRIRIAYGVSYAASSLASTGVSLGALFGGALFGWLNDAIGRRTCMMIEAVWIGSFAMLHLLLPVGTDGWQFACFVFLRIGIGIPFGGLSSMAPIHLIEFLPSGVRGLISGIGSLGWSWGSIYVFIRAATVDESWQSLLSAPAPVCVVFFIALFFVYESPRWLFVAGRRDDGRVVVNWILQSPELCESCRKAPVGLKTAPANIVVSLEKAPELSLQDRLRGLFEAKLRRTTICCILGLVAVAGSTYGLYVWAPTFLQALLGQDKTPYELLLWGEVAAICGTLSAAGINDHIGRQLLLVFSCIAFALGIAFLPHANGLVAITMLYLWISFANPHMWSAAAVYAAEALPTDMRGTGNAVAWFSARATGMMVPLVMGLILEGDGLFGFAAVATALYVLAVVAFAGAIVAMFFPRETAGLKMEDV
eukprot:gnl/TRDRNA2_/TRDRNA2_165789_c0_seq2.p1 gnl/TRDRNA2_/TRDRNA2_165789_c0~~gnl/TRDRNA2_/TRDRNA2_165789_c0_seq2.p1  ORF type:complete len:492 (+),score=74.98 gnl/TRDRNA2_/TRDRNA2_165789_c0_seq2:83-1558(+)